VAVKRVLPAGRARTAENEGSSRRDGQFEPRPPRWACQVHDSGNGRLQGHEALDRPFRSPECYDCLREERRRSRRSEKTSAIGWSVAERPIFIWMHRRISRFASVHIAIAVTPYRPRARMARDASGTIGGVRDLLVVSIGKIALIPPSATTRA
jgi:hypothetical protein